jgi:hypothetical protein
MTRRLIAYASVTILLFVGAVAAGGTASVGAAGETSATLRPTVHVSSVDTAALQAKGRYKKDGENCVWDVNDSGPNQCTPQTAGRFKKSGDSCVWDANDRGRDQCTPPSGRWKTQGSRCVWDPKDSGPNQCNPRQPRQ